MTRIIPAIFALVAVALPDAAWAQSPTRLSLTDAIARGFANSHRLAEARAREQGARAAVTSAELADRPTFNANAGYSRTNHVLNFGFPRPDGALVIVFPDVPDNFTSRLSFQWPIYTSGRTDALERAAIAEASAAGADIETARADLRLEIVRAYWAAVTAREAERVLEESTARAEAQVADAKNRFDVGLIPPNEVSTLEAQRSRERAQLIEATNIREGATIELRRLIGVPHDTVLELTDRLDAGAMGAAGAAGATGAAGAAGATGATGADVADLVKRALETRTERKALSFRMGGAEERQKAALTAVKPTVAFGGGFDYAKPNRRIFPITNTWDDSWDLGVSVNWNFFDFGRAKSQAAEAAAIVTATRERIAEFDEVVSADVRQRLLDIESSQAMVRAANDAVRSATDARRVVTDRFAAGVATSTDVLISQVQLLESELVRTRALAGVRLAEARLERALGVQQ
jgi:outer membrane protein